MNRPRLTSLNDLDGPAARPGYEPDQHGAGIVHIGIGAFHRAHQAVMTDDTLATHGGDWRIIGVSLRSKETADTLNTQNGLYTVLERGSEGTSARVIGSVQRVIAADPKATLDALCDPAIRIVSLTVTEHGYGIDPVSRGPDTSNAVVKADLHSPDAPKGVLGILTVAIKRRKADGLAPLTILSCDNLPENGKLLRDGVIGFARHSDQNDLADWIAENIAFPSSMVDRITPATTRETVDVAFAQTGCEDQAAVETEPFTQWVIEDNFPSGRPKWEAGGALFVSDVTPYERMKLTMLNGSHSLLAYAGFLVGHRFVRDVMRDPDLLRIIERHLDAAAHLLPPLDGVNLRHYAQALLTRFANPAIAHQTFQIATDGTQKLPQRIFQPALHAVEKGHDVKPFAFATAMWMRFCLGHRDDKTPYYVNDPRTDDLAQAVATAGSSAADLSKAMHAVSNLIPSRLATNPDWRAHIESTLSTALTHGCRVVLQQEAGVKDALRAEA